MPFSLFIMNGLGWPSVGYDDWSVLQGGEFDGRWATPICSSSDFRKCAGLKPASFESDSQNQWESSLSSLCTESGGVDGRRATPSCLFKLGFHQVNGPYGVQALLEWV